MPVSGSSPKKIVTIVGNRPQFIKMALVSKAIQKAGYREIIVHTGQHYDRGLSGAFFEGLEIAKPDYCLTVHEKTHGKMTAELLCQLEDLFLTLNPKNILVYGDTNSTLAATLTAVKMGIKIAHVEAGPRIHNRSNPEEINRVITDHFSTLLFCPDTVSVQHLAKENITNGVYFVGDVMYDLFLETQKKVTDRKYTAFPPERFLLMTLHRAENVDHAPHLQQLLTMIQQVDQKILFPIHPRTRTRLEEHGLYQAFQHQPNLMLVEPLGYADMNAALNQCTGVITDSGGLQKEAFFANKPCFVCFYETPWPDLLKSGWLVLLGTLDKVDVAQFPKTVETFQIPQSHPAFFGDGTAAEKIVSLLEEHDFFYRD